MLIRNRKSWELTEAQVTPEALYRNRRDIVKAMGLAAGAALLAPALPASAVEAPDNKRPKLDYIDGGYGTDEELTPFESVTTYNNFYEFGTDKGDPVRFAHRMETKPWSVKVEGAVAKPGVYDFEDLIRPHQLLERIYRLRCVEGWSMVIPWVGVPLKDIIARLEPTSDAKYVQFETLADKKAMRGLSFPVLDWPYVEGLRMDEAMNPLTLIAVGLYGAELPNQNGAPMRLVVPWKYGFKSIKSIVAMRFVKREPVTSWNEATPREYGFYSNVNPNVRHPRWSQARERRIGEFRRRKTLMFNGYGEEVAHLYAGMDLKRYF